MQSQSQTGGTSNDQGSASIESSPGSSSDKSQLQTPMGSPNSPLSPSQQTGAQAVPATSTGAAKGPAIPQGTPTPSGMVTFIFIIKKIRINTFEMFLLLK